MDIADWRKKIDELDRKLVDMLNQRAEAAREIGRLKRNTNLPIYEPDRERIVIDHVQHLTIDSGRDTRQNNSVGAVVDIGERDDVRTAQVQEDPECP